MFFFCAMILCTAQYAHSQNDSIIDVLIAFEDSNQYVAIVTNEDSLHLFIPRYDDATSFKKISMALPLLVEISHPEYSTRFQLSSGTTFTLIKMSANFNGTTFSLTTGCKIYISKLREGGEGTEQELLV